MEQPTDKKHLLFSEESELIGSILEGHPEQFRVLANRYGQQVLRLVGQLIPQKEDAEEVVQDTLMAAYQSLRNYDSQQANFRTWLMHIAYHTALKRLRSQSRMQFIEMEQMTKEDIPTQEIDVLLSDTTPDRLTLLKEALHQLSVDDQMLLSLYYYDDRSLKEIAYIVGHTDSYLCSRLQWIRKKISKTILTLEAHGKE